MVDENKIGLPIGDPFLGTVLAERYEIVALAGKGGMGVVYKARHQLLERFVAVKVLKSDLVYDEQSLLRFQVEAVAASRLTHPSVIPVYDYGVAPTGQPYLIMDFVEGKNLADVIEADGYLDLRRALPIFMQVCNALEHAHHNDIIHRDVKPSNILLVQTEGQPDTVKIVDFGIAQLGMLTDEGLRLTKTGELFGSPMYMSPEQCTGDNLDQRTDIYSLGAVMYEALLGVPPIVGKNAVDTIRRKLDEDPKPFKVIRPTIPVPAPIESVILKALERDPRRRFQTMHHLKGALEAAIQGVSVVRRSATGIPEIVSEYTGVDLRKEIQNAPPTVDKLKTKGRAAKLLKADKETATVKVDKLKAADQSTAPSLKNLAQQAERRKPVLIAVVLAVIAAIVIPIYLLGGPRLFPHTDHSSEALSMTGKINNIVADGKSNSSLTLVSADGLPTTFLVDRKTKVKGTLKKGLNVRILYSKRTRKLHADTILIQTP